MSEVTFRSRKASFFTFAASVAMTLIVAYVNVQSSVALEKGLQDQHLAFGNSGMREELLIAAKQSGSEWIRLNPRWDCKSKKISQVEHDLMRRIAMDAPRYGIKKILITPFVHGGAAFVASRTRRGPLASRALRVSIYREFIRSVATAMKDSPVERWYSPINEPNWYGSMPRRGAASHYRNLYRTAWHEIKTIDPAAKVSFGELSPFARSPTYDYPYSRATDPGDFTKAVLGLDNNWKPKPSKDPAKFVLPADGFNIHTYNFVKSPLETHPDRDKWVHGNLRYVRQRIGWAIKAGRLPTAARDRLFISEFAYKSSKREAIPRDLAARYLKLAWQHAKDYKVSGLLWYQLNEPRSAFENWNSGLRDKTGKAFPVWYTFKSLKP